MVNTIDDDYKLLERIRRGEGLEPLHDTNCDNSRPRSENDAKRRVMRTDKAFKILKNAAWLGSNDERDAIEAAVTMACNALATIDQITWERDMAIDQLRKLGYSLGERLRTEDEPISRRAALDVIRAMQTYKLYEGDDILLIDKAVAQTELMLLPSVQPERPKGHWIDTGSGQECSECGEIQYGYDNFRYYCAKCGSDNR